MSKDPELEKIIAAMPRSDPTRLLGGIAFVLGGQSMIWLTDAVDTFAAMGLLVTGLGVLLLWLWYRDRTPSTSPLIRALIETPRHIVWVYDRAAWKGREQVGEVHVHLEDGSRFMLLVPAASESNGIVDIFRRRAPTATFGWDRETELRYKSNPASLASRRASG